MHGILYTPQRTADEREMKKIAEAKDLCETSGKLAGTGKVDGDRHSRRTLDFFEFCLLILLFTSLMLQGFMAHRHVFYQYLAGFVLFAFVFLRYNRRFRRLCGTIVAYFAFACFALLSAVWARDVSLVLRDSQDIFATIPILIGIYLVCSTVGGVHRMFLALRVSILGTVVLALVLGGYSADERTFLGLISSGVGALMLMGFLAIFIEKHIREGMLWATTGLAAILIPIILVSSVRATAAIAIVLCAYAFFRWMTSRRGLTFGIAAVAAASTLTIAYVADLSALFEGTRYFRHFSHLSLLLEEGALRGSVGVRIFVQSLAFDFIEDSPLIGHGLENSRYLYQQAVGMATYSHSGYFETLIGLGAVGLCLFLLTFSEAVTVYLKRWSKDKRFAAMGLAVVAGILIFNFIGVVYRTTELLIILIVLVSRGLFEAAEDYRLRTESGRFR